MQGVGPPLVTPFDRSGDLDENKLRQLVNWIVERGVDFLVPCGSNSEAELMSVDERARVVEVVADEAPDDMYVLAGTGHPGLRETIRQTRLASKAGADGALVVTPFYYKHSDSALLEYYSSLADESSIPIYIYSVPVYTGVKLSVDVVESLSKHDNIHGMKDSSGDIETFERECAVTPQGFDMLMGSASVLAHALEAGASGGILALANVAPERSSEVFELYKEGRHEEARDLNSRLIELNRAVTSVYGIPGLKSAMRFRGAPAGYPRKPLREIDEEDEKRLQKIVKDVAD
ncbi:MAG: dihydrodipicolinate synthase family protein [Halobacteria archaeon]|nr:dihydrodipicolinate synthase family protein [Halobacteria archaeon]